MRYKLIARIEGEVYTREAITIQQGALLFEFVSDPSGKIISRGKELDEIEFFLSDRLIQ